ncbi:unnamed protein product [Chilo suppressalis]|uniref:Uncharacterized protein n=1 Tax=Chilo suppressalis TaxID=168631 RepID=A0ABN8BGT5_CHISP|nr:unnamed protein product [Chilo suppressalis]
MKVLGFVLAALLASVAANSVADQRANERFVEGIVAGAIEDLSNQIKERGLDPFEATASYYQRLAVTDLVVIKAEVEDFLLVGLSDIRVNRVSYNILLSRVNFDISLHRIAASVASASADLTVFGFKIVGSTSGSLEINNVRAAGQARISIGLSGVSLRSITIDVTLGGINSNLEVNALGRDLSESVNKLAGTIIPEVFDENRPDINRVLEHYILEMANSS